jgi:hypothetical protein
MKRLPILLAVTLSSATFALSSGTASATLTGCSGALQASNKYRSICTSVTPGGPAPMNEQRARRTCNNGSGQGFTYYGAWSGQNVASFAPQTFGCVNGGNNGWVLR